MNPISNSLPSVSTYNSSFASPVWLAQEIVTFPNSIFTFTGYFFSFSIDDAEIREILSKQSWIFPLFTFILVSHVAGIAFEYFKNSDEVFFAFPVYNGSFPAPLKALIDRFQIFYNARFFKNKHPPIEGVRQVTLIITAGGKIDPLPLITAQLKPIFTVCGCKLKKAVVLSGTDGDATLSTTDF